MLNIQLISAGLGALLALPLNAQEELHSKVEQLEQELKVLKRQLELDKEAATERSRTAPVFTAGAGGFVFRSADTNFVLKLRGYIQTDGRFFPDDVPSGRANDTLLLRRVRPILEGTVFEKFDYRLMLDFGSNLSLSSANDPFVQDAYVNARFRPWFQVQAGKFKEPVSIERLQSGANLLFVERPYTSQLAPNRDVGVQAHGEVLSGKLHYAFGVFNGVADGGSGDFETTDDEKDFAGRIFFAPFTDYKSEALRGVGFGVAGTIGQREGTARGYASAGQQTIFSYLGAAGAIPAVTAHGAQWRLVPQGYYYYGPFGLLGEYIISEQSLIRDPATRGTVQHRAWSVSGSYFLTGEANSYKAVTPRRSFNPSEGGWGAFEIAARVQGLEIDDGAFPAFASAATSTHGAFTWGLGFNWHLNKNFKVNLNYEQTKFDGGTAPLLRHGERVVLIRAQVSF